MKKESVNTFNQGLNFDLNPIVTPNDTLIDNINGTFLTFNDDELVLQNDSGNTKIKVAEDEYVELRNGFYPLGMKEYGGVLYIISAKTYDVKLPLKLNNIYHIGDMVYDGVNYYECLTDNLILENINIKNDSSNWKLLGTNLQVIQNDNTEIEIGSYPSIEDAKIGLLGSSSFSNSLEKIVEVSSVDFGSGKHIEFTSSVSPTNFVKGWNLENNFYTARLFLKTETGLIELTEDVWDQFIRMKAVDKNDTFKNINHWLTSNFKYFCPFGYKGKLLYKTTLNLGELYPSHDTVVTLLSDKDGIKTYRIDFKIEQVSSYLNVTEVSITDDSDKVTITEGMSQTINTSGITNLSIVVKTNSDVFFSLKIRGITFNHKINNIPITYDDIPKIINGKLNLTIPISLTLQYKDLSFELIEENFTEDTRYYTALQLNGINGPVGYDLEYTNGNKLILVREDTIDDKRLGYDVIGTFTVENNKIKTVNITKSPNFTNNQSIILHLEILAVGTTVIFKDDFGSKMPIYIEFSTPLAMDSSHNIIEGSLLFYQSDISDPLDYKMVEPGKLFEVYVLKKSDVYINFRSNYFEGGVFRIKHLEFELEREDNQPHKFRIALIPRFKNFEWKEKTVYISTGVIHNNYRNIFDHISNSKYDNLYEHTIYKVDIIFYPNENNDVFINNKLSTYNDGNGFKSYISVYHNNFNDGYNAYTELNTSKINNVIRGISYDPDHFINIDSKDYTGFGSDKLGWLLFPKKMTFINNLVTPREFNETNNGNNNDFPDITW